LTGYACAIEPGIRLEVTEYAVEPVDWPTGFRLSIAVIADLHVGEPYMGLGRIEAIVEATNSLGADLIVILGDYAAGHSFVTKTVSAAETMAALARLSAPLGRFAILGNHDYWHDAAAWRRALAVAGIPLLENDAVRLTSDGRGFWLAGTASILAIPLGAHRFRGLDDLPGTLAKVSDDAPVILLAHEPDIFPRVPRRVALTLSGHTHGGQVRLFGYSPRVPSAYGNRFAYGQVTENGRDMIVSAGLGVSIVPVRLGIPPEIVLVRIGDGPIFT
jgi:predicted MPP superfamily phosphohydrolase